MIQLPGPIFAQPWWLDAVAPNAWDSVVLFHEGEQVARLPYCTHKSRGLTFVTMPPLTQSLGPWLCTSQAKYSKKLAQEKDLMTELIAGLPFFDLFQQNFHYSITNWLPFHWHDFQQTTRYTYILEDISNLDNVWSSFMSNIRSDIRKAEKQLEVRSELPLTELVDLAEMSYKHHNRSLPYSREVVERLDDTLTKFERRRILAAVDAQERTHAAIFLVWDNNSMYYLMGGGNPHLRTSGAMSLLLWHAIQFAATVTKQFDFEGSMVEPIERFFRAFGARQIPYFQVTKKSRRMKCLSAINELRQALINQS